MVVAPRLMRTAPGKSSRTSAANWRRRALGSREVVTQTRGSRSALESYSSSACLEGRATAVPSSSSSSLAMAAASRRRRRCGGLSGFMVWT
jgi:hypothetical protein